MMKQAQNGYEQRARQIRYLPANPELKEMAAVIPDLVYTHQAGVDLTLQLIVPWSNLPDQPDKPRRPLVVFIQGSAWTTPNVYAELPQLAQLARSGLIVATIIHSSCLDGHPFPAYLQDAKTAVRYLRDQADHYGIDPERVAVWGTSSGGNAALLMGLTGDDPTFRTEDYSGQSDAVRCVVSCFGPSDLTALYRHALTAITPDALMPIFHGLLGQSGDPDTVMAAMSPVRQIKAGQAYPPFLLVHGDADQAVPFEQSVRFYQSLLKAGIDGQMIGVRNAPHEGSFWSQALLDEITAWLRQQLADF